MKLAVALCLLAGASAIIQDSSEICTVKLYKHCNYGGYVGTFPHGNKYSDLRRDPYYIKNDDVSSVKITGQCSVTLYEHIKYGGNAVTLTKSDPCLVDNGFNDKASSFKVKSVVLKSVDSVHGGLKPLSHHQCAVATYQHCNFRGIRHLYWPGHYTKVPRNDDISSYIVYGNCKVSFYEHYHFGGKEWNIAGKRGYNRPYGKSRRIIYWTKYDRCLVDNGNNDKISSLRVQSLDFKLPLKQDMPYYQINRKSAKTQPTRKPTAAPKQPGFKTKAKTTGFLKKNPKAPKLSRAPTMKPTSAPTFYKGKNCKVGKTTLKHNWQGAGLGKNFCKLYKCSDGKYTKVDRSNKKVCGWHNKKRRSIRKCSHTKCSYKKALTVKHHHAERKGENHKCVHNTFTNKCNYWCYGKKNVIWRPYTKGGPKRHS